MKIYKEWCVPPDKLKQLERRSRQWSCCGPSTIDEKAHSVGNISLPKSMSHHELELRWDGIIWLGDFNSRIEGYQHEGKDSHYSVLSALERG